MANNNIILLDPTDPKEHGLTNAADSFAFNERHRAVDDAVNDVVLDGIDDADVSPTEAEHADKRESIVAASLVLIGAARIKGDDQEFDRLVLEQHDTLRAHDLAKPAVGDTPAGFIEHESDVPNFSTPLAATGFAVERKLSRPRSPK